jgi:PAS domain S-box-containing protein
MPTQPPWKIVLIDDEPGIRKVTGIALKDAGYEVAAAADGPEGLALCAEVRPQIVITDVRMPGMDGIAVLERLKTDLPDIEVIVATAFGEMDLAIRALQLDASDFITKPINDEALHLALDRAKERHTRKKQIADYTRLLEEGWNETTAELMETFEYQNNLIESSMDGIAGFDADEKVVVFNRSMETISGYPSAEVRHQFSLSRFFRSAEETAFRQALADESRSGAGRLFLHETTLLGRDGQDIPAQLSASVISSREGADAGLVLFVRDLRELRRLEREMEDQAKILHQDKMMSLGRLAASVVHEINNPLAGVLNYCRLMLRIVNRGGKLTPENLEKFTQYLTLVESETGRCSEIISSLLTFSRKSPAEFGPVDVKNLVERSVLLSQHKLDLSNIRVETDLPEALPTINGDFNQLQQCLINLIFNAIDAMPTGGVLRLSAAADPPRNRLTLSVRDTGLGIPEENLPHIFEPFFTSKAEGYGVGLGLSTLYGIIQHHNGDVAAESAEGKGTTFFIHFPI